ncbi:MAG: ABC transporter ATP-binding protein/permease [Proteobacteria bacterium]|nr:ABC transporter ATP-binding protein/permease [Pseudomonadota bacterium]
MHNFGYLEEGNPGSVGDARLWWRILGYCRGHGLALTGTILLSLIITVASLALPRLMQTGIDTSIIAEGISRPERIAGLGRAALFYGLLVGLVFLATFLQVVVLEWIGQSIMHRLRQHLFTHLLTLDLHFFHNQPAGRLVTRLTNDIENMHEMFTSVMVTLFNDGLKLVGIFWFLFLMNSRLALVMMVFVPLAAISTAVFSHFAREKFRAIRSQLALINSFLAESLAGMAVIQCFGGQERIGRIHGGLTQEYLVRSFGQIKVFGLFMPLIDLMSSAAIGLIIWYGGGEVIRRHLTIGELAAFVSYMRLFFQPLRELSQKYSLVQAAMASAERIFQTLDTKSTLPAPALSAAAVPVPVAGGVWFKGVEFGYQPGQTILRKIDLRLSPGETVALVGTTGAGKSTLVSLLVRFYDPTAGQVLIDGTDVRSLPLAFLRQRVGLIMQDIFILPDTVRANIILDQQLDERRLASILDQTGLQAFVDRLPQGLSTRIGEGALNLSLGEKQLLSFVRVLYRDPAILVLDEATASIDTESENMLEQALAAGFRGRTSLVIAHRLSTIRRVDRIVVMDQGRIVEQGSHDHLMARESVYRGLVRLDGE